MEGKREGEKINCKRRGHDTTLIYAGTQGLVVVLFLCVLLGGRRLRQDGRAGCLRDGLPAKAASTLRRYFRSHCFDMFVSIYVDSVV